MATTARPLARVPAPSNALTDSTSDIVGGYARVGYFVQWGIYGRQYFVKDMDAAKMTHVNYAFGNIDPVNLTVTTKPEAAVAYQAVYSDNGGNVHSNTPDDEKRTAKRGRVAAERLKDWRKWAGDQPPTNNHPLRNGKGTLYEGGVRVPLMVAWPGVVKPGTTSVTISTQNPRSFSMRIVSVTFSITPPSWR